MLEFLLYREGVTLENDRKPLHFDGKILIAQFSRFSFLFRMLIQTLFHFLVQGSIRCTCIKDSIGVMHLLTDSLLIMGMWNVGKISPWMSLPRNTTPRNLYVPIISFADLNLFPVMVWCVNNRIF